MAIIHRATITPTKLELLDAWLATPASGGLEGPDALSQVGNYRLDDPDGEVGIEGLLITRGGPLRHVVVTYRAAPLDGADAHLITTMEHSVLGQRWVYDASGDPVAIGAFRRALAGQQEQAALEVWDGDTLVETREPTVRLAVENPAASPDGLQVHLAAQIGAELPGSSTLVATWDGGTAVIASA
ncbi:maltokinase N-terminal cap-like domain-containing protein [Nocardioides sp. Soil796]|uniref:maltokinase N-terminal cap-like domain-containing protein n=1 Tax=Nocardioides sp. Soil796 TaxID=1736412 RepID=UPI00070EFFFD|nr:hypothetical protein [Nocardioides sp. Soil796]KRF15060.1 hypothetical protein ASH02_12520 [Nocardioides sp. Soil796]